jgi:hypothetical protein
MPLCVFMKPASWLLPTMRMAPETAPHPARHEARARRNEGQTVIELLMKAQNHRCRRGRGVRWRWKGKPPERARSLVDPSVLYAMSKLGLQRNGPRAAASQTGRAASDRKQSCWTSAHTVMGLDRNEGLDA